MTFGSTVTILFSDIRGFTEFTESRGDEAAYRMLQQHNTLVQEQIALYGGHVVETLGDSFMVSFDAARTAITCAIAMQRSIERQGRDQQGPKIEIGVGIDTGEPVREADDFFGSTVNRASRICGAAVAGRILASETVRHVVGRMQGAEWLDRGHFDVKGFTEPLRLFEVDWTSTGAVRANPVFVPQATAAGPMPEGLPPVSYVAAASTDIRKTAGSGAARTGRPAWLAPAAVAAVVVVLGAAALVLGQGFRGGDKNAVEVQAAAAPQPTSTQAAPPQKLLAADDFSDPRKGLFVDNQRGTGRYTVPAGRTNAGFAYTCPYEGKYQDGALVARVGPYPQGLSGRYIGMDMRMADRPQGNVAIEVESNVTKSPAQAWHGVRMDFSGDDAYRAYINTQNRSFEVYAGDTTLLDSGRSNAINLGGAPNALRVAFVKDTLTLSVNGQQVSQVRHDGLTRRTGNMQLAARMAAQPAEGEVEVRFKNFKVYALE